MKKQNNNPWEILGIPPNSGLKAIKDAYKNLAKKYHPDGGGTVKQWLEISQAYEAIINKKHVPIMNAPSTELVNIKLSVKQQILGIDDVILVDIGGEEMYISVTIPPGAQKDDKFHIKDKNQKYIINIKELANKDFTRQGIHLIMYKTLDLISVLKRGTIIINGPEDDYIEVQIPDDIMISGSIITVPGHGLYSRKTKKRGNLRIHVKTSVPKLTDENIEEFITRLKND